VISIITHVDAQKIDSICGFSKSNSSQKFITLGSPRLTKKSEAALLMIDNVRTSIDILCQIPENIIKSINVLKLVEAVKKFGAHGKNGAIIVETIDTKKYLNKNAKKQCCITRKLIFKITRLKRIRLLCDEPKFMIPTDIILTKQ
jgi:hypothetical protein